MFSINITKGSITRQNIGYLLLGLFIGLFLIYILLYLYIATAPAPNEPSYPNINDTDNIDLDCKFSWHGGNPTRPMASIVSPMLKRLLGLDLEQKLTYYIYLGKSEKDLKLLGVESENTNSFKPSECLEPDRTYYWQIRAKNNFNEETWGPIWNFATKTSPVIQITKDRNNFGVSEAPAFFNIIQTEGISNSGINISYNLGSQGWINIPNPVVKDKNELLETKGIAFSYKGGGDPNTLELKLAYNNPNDTNTTTFVYRFHSKTFTDDLEPKKIYYSYTADEVWSYPPKKPCSPDSESFDVAQLKSIDFAVSNQPGDTAGSGWIILDNVRGIIEC